DACLALVDEGDLRPSAVRISERAGVSVRSVFQHFDDMEALFTATSDRLGERIAPLQMTVDPDMPLDERIRTVVRQRAPMLEAITPFRRAANVHAPFADEVNTRVQMGHTFLRGEVGRIF